LSGRVTRVKG